MKSRPGKSQPRFVLLKEWVVALSYANLLLFNEWANFLGEPGGWSQYERPIPNSYGTTSIILSAILIASIFVLVHRAGKAFDPKLSRWFGTQESLMIPVIRIFFLALLLSPLNRIRALSNISVLFPLLSFKYYWESIGSFFLGVALLFVLLPFLVLLSRFRKHIVPVTTLGFQVFSPFVLVTFSRALLVVFSPFIAPKTMEFFEQRHTPPGRVVWILYDELDERLTFSDRPKMWTYPQFDRFRGESIVATNAYPPWGNTVQSIPSLLTQRMVHSFQPSGPRSARLRAEGEYQEASFHEDWTIFHEAKKLHANTGIVGWFHPYCRLFNPNVQSCQRASRIAYQYPKNIAANVGAIAQRIFSFRFDSDLHTETYKRSQEKALELVADPRFNFVFLHLPVPHPPFIYDPAKKRISTWVPFDYRGYFGNVELADNSFGELRRAMEHGGVWDKTTVIVSSDHHWRGSEMYDGRLDLRVPLMIKPPGPTKPGVIEVPLNTVKTASLVIRALKGESITASEIRAALPKVASETPYQLLSKSHGAQEKAHSYQ